MIMMSWNRWDLRARRSFSFLSPIAALTIGLAVCWPRDTKAHDDHHKREIKTEQVQARRVPDVRLTDQGGHQVRFLSDVLRQRPAVISFIYTSCETTCPLVGATVAAVAEHFQKDSSKFAIVSVSVDPNHDTPARLLTWRERYGDIPQWTLLTGPKRDVDQLLRALGTYSANLEDHSDILLLGPDAAGRWTRMSAFAETDKITAAIQAATVPAAK
jgi:protein SCO1